jgi:hypothetical protein
LPQSRYLASHAMGVFEPDAGNGTIITLANAAAQIKFVRIARTNKSEFYTLTITRCLIVALQRTRSFVPPRSSTVPFPLHMPTIEENELCEYANEADEIPSNTTQALNNRRTVPSPSGKRAPSERRVRVFSASLTDQVPKFATTPCAIAL